MDGGVDGEKQAAGKTRARYKVQGSASNRDGVCDRLCGCQAGLLIIRPTCWN